MHTKKNTSSKTLPVGFQIRNSVYPTANPKPKNKKKNVETFGAIICESLATRIELAKKFLKHCQNPRHPNGDIQDMLYRMSCSDYMSSDGTLMTDFNTA